MYFKFKGGLKMPIIKIFDYDTSEVITTTFKTVKVKGAKITVVFTDDDKQEYYGKIIEVKGVI